MDYSSVQELLNENLAPLAPPGPTNFSTPLIGPEHGVDHKILQITPDPDIDYKILIVRPDVIDQ